MRPPHIPVVYRMYDRDETLLYIGCTVRPVDRLPTHHKKSWWTRVARIDLEHFDAVTEALNAERVAIEAERPLFTAPGRGGQWPSPESQEKRVATLRRRSMGWDADEAQEVPAA